MKLSENWLRQWVNPLLERDQLIEKLNMAGLAVESCTPVDDDYVLEFELTPNRGDCLSIEGIAREVAALTGCTVNAPQFNIIPANTSEEFPIDIQAPADSPRYCGRVVSGFKPNVVTPVDIKNRLIKSGIKTISPIVDVLNYIMLEIGQPLHAFDLKTLKNAIVVRRACDGEQLTLLDEKTVTLDKDVLVIADSEKVHAIAGIMGGLTSSVKNDTTAIFIESAFFKPTSIAGRARRYGLHTDASHRFERGVDPDLARKAIERATQLLLQIYDNDLSIGPVIEKQGHQFLPDVPQIHLRNSRIQQLLGITLSHEDISLILQRLNMRIQKHSDGWLINPPSYRFDITEEIDLIEEIARLHGYQYIPSQVNLLPLQSTVQSEKITSLSLIKQMLVNQGYFEIITYSFIAEHWQNKIAPHYPAIVLDNPLSSEYAVMRCSLWPGLLEVVQHNSNRQQPYLRFFETGLRFLTTQEELQQELVLSGIWAGSASPEQWGEKIRHVDFFDVKNDLSQLFSAIRIEDDISWHADQHPTLHPTQSAKILYRHHVVGWCGALHPKLQAELDINMPVFLFELSLSAINNSFLPVFAPISKFPHIRRDIALLVDTKTTAYDLIKSIKTSAGDLLAESLVFDIYQGKNIPVSKKSIALGLIFQAPDRTLIEDEVNLLVADIIAALESQHSAILRE